MLPRGSRRLRTDLGQSGPRGAGLRGFTGDAPGRWLLTAGLWNRQRRRDQHRSHRPRRQCFGELIQIDASIHPWLDWRGEEMVLVTMIDDAANRMLSRFYEGETVEAYFDLVSRWLASTADQWRSTRTATASSRPRARGNELRHDPVRTSDEELGIELILAQSPQAKGRVERSHETCQDRWVKLSAWLGSRRERERTSWWTTGCWRTTIAGLRACRQSRWSSAAGSAARCGRHPEHSRGSDRGQRLYGAVPESSVSTAQAGVAGFASRACDHRTAFGWDPGDSLW